MVYILNKQICRDCACVKIIYIIGAIIIFTVVTKFYIYEFFFSLIFLLLWAIVEIFSQMCHQHFLPRDSELLLGLYIESQSFTTRACMKIHQGTVGSSSSLIHNQAFFSFDFQDLSPPILTDSLSSGSKWSKWHWLPPWNVAEFSGRVFLPLVITNF